LDDGRPTHEAGGVLVIDPKSSGSIGKALGLLNTGTGVIDVLVSLQ
jgi:hypothetical protein